MDEDYIKLREASQLLGKNESSLRRDCRAGKYPCRQVMRGKKPEWEIHRSALVPVKNVVYQKLYDQWVFEMKNGYHTGKRMSVKGVEASEYGVEKFWEFLQMEPNINAMTVENLGRALANVEPDHENKNCHYSKRIKIYSGFRSFYKFLCREGLKAVRDLEQTKRFYPKEIYPKQQVFIEDPKDFEKLLKVNDSWLGGGRTEFDQELLKTYLLIGHETGMRRGEILSLTKGLVFLQEGYIYVQHGKGNRNRRVGITPRLEAQLKVWEQYRPDSLHANLLLTKDGEPVTKDGIKSRVANLSKKAKVKLTSHALRRTFITENLKEGMPIALLQQATGHSNLKTLQGYNMLVDKDAIDYLRNKGRKDPQPVDRRELLRELLLEQ